MNYGDPLQSKILSGVLSKYIHLIIIVSVLTIAGYTGAGDDVPKLPPSNIAPKSFAGID